MRYQLLVIIIIFIVLFTSGCVGSFNVSSTPTPDPSFVFTPTTKPTASPTPPPPPSGPYEDRNVDIEVKRVDSQIISVTNTGGSDASSLVNIWVNGNTQPTSGRVTSQVGSVAYYQITGSSFVQVIGGFPDCNSLLWSGLIDSQITNPTPAPTYNPTPYSPFIITNTPVPTLSITPSPVPGDNYYTRVIKWSYKYNSYTTTLNIPKDTYNFYKGRPHNRASDYAMYAMSDYDRAYIKSLVDGIEEAASKNGYSKYDTVMMVIAFVQSLPYTSDLVTTGFDNYPRYPIETLVDNGGDCEDTAILTAALLNEMHYGTVLLLFPTHMAVGVMGGEGIYGTYWEYKGSKYFYLETTGEGWNIGQVPDQYKTALATIYPMTSEPQLSLQFTYSYSSSDLYANYYKVHCDLNHIGTGTAENVTVYVAALALSKGNGVTWVPAQYVNIGNINEAGTGWADCTLRIPKGETSQIECIAYGNNFYPVVAYANNLINT